MSDYYKNAAPMTVDRGRVDKSRTKPIPVPFAAAQHVPKFYIKAAKGQVGSARFNKANGSLINQYGAETFREGSKFFNHQTYFLNQVVEAGNNCIVHRIISKDATDVANITLYMDILETDVTLYEKEIDGSYKLDKKGDPVPVKVGDVEQTTKGYKVTWVVDHVSVPLGEYSLGGSKVREGIQTVGNKQSKQYPIFEIPARDPGSAGLVLGVTFGAYTERDVEFPHHLLNNSKQYPYFFTLGELKDPTSLIATDVRNSLGNTRTTFVADSQVVNKDTGASMGFEKIINDYYSNDDVSLDSGIGKVKVYENNLKTVVDMLYASEKAHTDEFTDSVLTEAKPNPYAINIMSLVNSNGSPYNSIQLVDVVGGTRLTKTTRNFLEGGDDGELTDEEYEEQVRQDIMCYSDPLHPYQNHAKHVESDIYDSGFSLETKLAFGNFIAIRKDTFVHLSTFIDGKTLSMEEQLSMAITIDTMLSMYPESTIEGEPAVRGIINAFSGEGVNTNYTGRLPTTLEVAIKTAKLMGKPSGKWDNTQMFDRANVSNDGGSVIKFLKNFDYDWVPASTRNIFWATNLNFPLTYSTEENFIPALKTICKDDTSTMNSYFVVKASCYLTRIGHASWREYSGSIDLTDEQLVVEVDNFIATAARECFGNNFRVVPRTTVTAFDAQRGWSWSTFIELYSPTMKTATTLLIETYRFSDYQFN